MGRIWVRPMQLEDEYFVSTCSHVGESDEIDRCAERRRTFLRDLRSGGATIAVAVLAGEPVGFAFGIPIESSPWGPLGDRLTSLPCLYVTDRGTGQGTGRALVEAVEAGARSAGRLGVATVAYRGLGEGHWFLPAAFYEHLGYEVVDRHDRSVLLWRRFSPDAEAPRLLRPHYTFAPTTGRVTVDLFWNRFCQTSDIEAERVRAVCAGFGDRVLLREYPAHDPDLLRRYQIPRGIYVDGREIGWGYEAPEEGVREAIARAIARV